MATLLTTVLFSRPLSLSLSAQEKNSGTTLLEWQIPTGILQTVETLQMIYRLM